MEKIKGLAKLIGNTKTIKIVYKIDGILRHVYCKCEWLNLSGSVKDRVAFRMLSDAYKDGRLQPGGQICEVTSGNMGISLAAVSRILGNEVIACMPEFMSKERIELLKLYGAKVELYKGFDECFHAADEYGKKGTFLPKQFENKSNFLAHYEGTGVEILKSVPQIDAFIAGVGTSGTLSGCGTYLKENTNCKVYALEPSESKILSTKVAHGPHGIQGLSDDLIPKLFDYNLIDGIVEVSTEDSISMAQKLCKELGLGVGISSGANFLGAVLLAEENVVTVFSDDNKKYLSTDLTKNIKSNLVDRIELIGIEEV